MLHTAQRGITLLFGIVVQLVLDERPESALGLRLTAYKAADPAHTVIDVELEPELEVVAHFEAQQDDYCAILSKALADRLAEALAEYMHKRVREELWAYAQPQSLDNEALIREEYQGIRPAPGYPACPDHTEKEDLFRILDATNATGIRLTESFAMLPAASVSGYYFSHPEAAYFGIGRINRDQVEDYARRKGMDIATVERWLAPNLAY